MGFNIFKKLPKLNFLIYNEDNTWIAHCLELDMVGFSPDSAESAVNELIELIKTQIQFAIENDNLNSIFTPAPSDLWIKRLSAKKCSYKQLKKLKQYKNVEFKSKDDGSNISIGQAELCYV